MILASIAKFNVRQNYNNYNYNHVYCGVISQAIYTQYRPLVATTCIY